MADRRADERRELQDRRQINERRRYSENRRVAFELCRSTLHMALVVRGEKGQPDRVITRSIRWRDEAPSLHAEIGARELAKAFHTLVTEERLTGATTRIALNGEFCVTRVVTGSSEKVRREMDEVVERSNQYLLLGPGEKTTARSIQPLDARHEHALLTVANQNTLQLLVDIADSTGLKLEVIEPSLVALSRAQARLSGDIQEACLIVQLDEGEAELGVCHQGRLLLDYRPGGRADAENIADIVAEHLQRVQRFLGRQHESVQQPLRHVYLSGELDVVRQARLRFAALKQFEVHVLEPSQLDAGWVYASDAPDTEFSATLGAALSSSSTPSQEHTPNLIERVLASSREPLRPFLMRAAIPLAAVLLLTVTLAGLWARDAMTINRLREELTVYNPARQKAEELKLTLVRTETRLNQLRALEAKLPKADWGELLKHIAQSMPNDVWLDRITLHDSHTASLAGSSYTDGGVYDFVNHLKEVPEVDQIDLEGTGVGHTPTGPTTSFDMELSLAKSSDDNKQ
jgi:Fimbrial assembly protein (PilN)